jgi:hypothetical protein
MSKEKAATKKTTKNRAATKKAATKRSGRSGSGSWVERLYDLDDSL